MITLSHVTFSYPASSVVPVIRDLSLELSEHTRLAVTGPSGAGKTTLFRLIAGLETPQSGAVTRREGLSLSAVFQEDRLLPFRTILENAALFGDRKRASELLDRLGLSDVKNSRPEELSGGMKRRAALVRALCHPFDLLLLDEPFTGLDPDSRKLCIEAIRETSADRALLLISHDPGDAENLGVRETIRLT